MTNKDLSNQSIISDALRFIGVGGINTLFTIILYQILLTFLTHQYAYSLSWLSGFIFLMIVYPSKVFIGGMTTQKRKLLMAILYLLIFIVSLWFLDFLVALQIHKRLAIFIVIIFSSLLNFFLIRRILRDHFVPASIKDPTN